MKNKHLNIRKMTVTAIMSGLSAVLMALSFNVPLVPSFLKMDISELPALISAFALGPVAGMAVCLIKNLINLFFTTTAGVGELVNFLLGASFVVTAGLIYKKQKTRKGAIIGSLTGALVMAVLSVPLNYFAIYPAYVFFYGIPMDAILAMYNAILPGTDTLIKALLIFNLPFTFIKGLINVALTFLIYKSIAPIIKGADKK
jgi:riboflavin transporter FmnP